MWLFFRLVLLIENQIAAKGSRKSFERAKAAYFKPSADETRLCGACCGLRCHHKSRKSW
jgi:hypothetical protein